MAVRKKNSDPIAAGVARIVRWMETHAPVLADNLAPGATSAELTALQKKHRLPLPDEAARLWKVHDGQLDEQNGFVGSMDLLSSAESFARRRDVLPFVAFCREHASEWCGPQLTEEEIRSDAWLPLANRDSDSIVVSGVSGRVFTCGKDAPPLELLAPSIGAWITDYANAIEAGEYDVKPGFGDVYLQRASPGDRWIRENAERARAVLPTLLAAAKKRLGSFGKVSATAVKGIRGGVRLRVERQPSGSREAIVGASLEANAFACLTRTFCDERLQIVEARLSLAAAESPLVLDRVAAELDAIATGTRSAWRLQKLDAKTRDALARGGHCVVLVPAGRHYRVDGPRPIFAARISDTFQMRGFASMRAPTSARALETVNAMNVEASKAERASSVFVFEGQIGAGAGSVFGKEAGPDAEQAYWDVDALLEQVTAHGTAPRAAPEVVDAALARKAEACLDALVT